MVSNIDHIKCICFHIYIVEHLFTFCINLYVAVLYFLGVATIAALVGHVVTKVIAILGRASLIIFILVGTIFVSTISLGECAPFDLY